MPRNKTKIVFIHHLNNYTGSPAVLASVIRGFVAKGYSVSLLTNHSEGFLSGLEGVEYHYIHYRWSPSAWITLCWLVLAQAELFFSVLFRRRRNTVFYLNTIIPFGAALACCISGKRFVYHIHENMQQDKALYRIARSVYNVTNRKSIFVSSYVKSVATNCREGVVVHNCLDSNFRKRSEIQKITNRHTILMIASLRGYKGIYEFAALSRLMPDYEFVLVVNATEREVGQFREITVCPDNLFVYSTQKDVHPFYRRAKILLQLSHPEQCVETFGMTILEAMAYGLPAIAPNVGGPTELITNGINGILVNPMDLKEICERIQTLMTNDALYNTLSINALDGSKKYAESKMITKIEQYI